MNRDGTPSRADIDLDALLSLAENGTHSDADRWRLVQAIPRLIARIRELEAENFELSQGPEILESYRTAHDRALAAAKELRALVADGVVRECVIQMMQDGDPDGDVARECRQCLSQMRRTLATTAWLDET